MILLKKFIKKGVSVLGTALLASTVMMLASCANPFAQDDNVARSEVNNVGGNIVVARSVYNGSNGSVNVSGMTNGSLTVTYESAKKNFARLYVSEGNGVGLVLANADMSYSNGVYSYTLNHPTFTKDSEIYIAVLVNDGSEYCVPQGVLSDTTSWSKIVYGKETAAADGIVSGGVYSLVAKCSGKSADGDDWGTVNGTNVIQWSLGNNQANQQWKISSVGEGYYSIINVHSGLCLDVAEVSAADGANIHLWEYVGGDNQKWKLEKQADGSYRITSKFSGKVLDVAAASAADGANIQQYTWNGTDAQKWILTLCGTEENNNQDNNNNNNQNNNGNVTYSRYLDKETLVNKTTGLMTMQFKNTTNGAWRDSEIYITAVALDSNNRWCYLRPDGALVPIGANETSASWSYTLEQLRGGIQMPAMSSGRMYISMGSPVVLRGILAADGNIGIVQPDLNNPNDANHDKYFDWIEFTLSDVGFWGNTTQVDQFSFPVVMAMYNTDGYYRSVGVTESREQIFSAFEQLGDGFATLVERPYRIIAPCKGQFRTGRAFGTYMQSYVDECWNYYLNGAHTANISHPLGDFKGYSTSDGQFVFECTNSGWGSIAQVGKKYFVKGKPNNDELFEGSGVLASPSVGADGNQTTVELALQAWVCAALNRHIFTEPQNWANPSTWYKGGKANYYAAFWHEHNIDGAAYGFCYDDVFDQSSLIQTGNPRGLVIGIGW